MHDRSTSTFNGDYDFDRIGTESFECKLLKGVHTPSMGYPSFKYLNVQELEVDTKVFAKVAFETMLAKIPKAPEDGSPDLLEKFIYNLSKKIRKDVFIDFPW